MGGIALAPNSQRAMLSNGTRTARSCAAPRPPRVSSVVVPAAIQCSKMCHHEVATGNSIKTARLPPAPWFSERIMVRAAHFRQLPAARAGRHNSGSPAGTSPPLRALGKCPRADVCQPSDATCKPAPHLGKTWLPPPPEGTVARRSHLGLCQLGSPLQPGDLGPAAPTRAPPGPRAERLDPELCRHAAAGASSDIGHISAVQATCSAGAQRRTHGPGARAKQAGAIIRGPVRRRPGR